MATGNLESQKLDFEFFKHLTTVNTATAILVPAVAGALGLSRWPPLIALILFSVSIGLSIWGMRILSSRVGSDENNTSSPGGLLNIVPILFVSGLIIFWVDVVVESLA